MKKHAFKLAPISLSVLFSLTGCIEVDDSGNKQVVASLNQQNAILAEQNALLSQQLQEEAATITVSGAVFDTDAFMPVSGSVATVQVLKGETVLVDSVSTEDGLFSIEGLPASSDLSLYVTFSDGSYVDRVFFITTPPAAEDVTFDDIGYLSVSKPVEVSFSILDSQSGEAISDLVFSGTSHSGTSSYSTAYMYQHVAEFDADEGVYRITLPKYLDVTLRANLDINGDGDVDYDLAAGNNAYIVGDRLMLVSANEMVDNVVSLSVDVESPVETKIINVSLLDMDGNPIEGASFVNDENETVVSEYNADEQYYVISADFDGYLSLSMPSFTQEETTYSSGKITIDRYTNSQTGDYLRIYTNGFDTNLSYNIEDYDELFLAVIANPTADLFNVQLVTSFLSAEDYDYTVYYSEPVLLTDEQVSLTYERVAVTPGNESTEDNIPVGFTYITSTDESASINIESGKNSTTFTLSAVDPLLPGTEYTYEIGTLLSPDSSQEIDVYNDQRSFTTSVAASQAFDINDVYIDNHNYYSNGTILVSENTAGVASNYSNRSGSLYLHFPTSIETLNYLVVNVTGYTQNGVDYPDTESLDIVLNNNVRVSKTLGVVAAANEDVRNEASVSYTQGSTMENGVYEYIAYSGQYLNDNEADNVNAVTLNYEYQTQDGDTVSGTLTLPVM